MTVLHAVVGSRIRLGPFEDEARKLVEPLRSALTVEPRAPVFRRRSPRRFKDKPSQVALMKPVRQVKDCYYVPRGATGLIRKLAKQHGIEVTWHSEVTGLPVDESGLVPVADLGVALRPYQETAAKALVSRVQGMVVIPAGGGKTVCAVAALAMLNRSAIVVVPSKDIRDQWPPQLSRMYSPKVRLLGDGYKDRGSLRPGEVLVAIADSLDDSKSDALLASADVIVLDEAHRMAGARIQKILERSPSRWRWSLTATPYRADGWESLFPYLVGPVLHTSTVDELVAGGWLMRPRVIGLQTMVEPDAIDHRYWEAKCPACGWEQDINRETARRLFDTQAGVLGDIKNTLACNRTNREGEPSCWGLLGIDDIRGSFDHPSASRDIALVPNRVAAIAEILRWGFSDGRLALCLLPTRASCDAHHEMLMSKGIPSRVVYSDAPMREDSMKRFREGRIRVIFATNIADEGLDVPDIDLLVQAIPGRAKRGTVQRAGRTQRPGSRPPIVIDVIDGGAHQDQWEERRKQYRDELGVEPELRSIATLFQELWGQSRSKGAA